MIYGCASYVVVMVVTAGLDSNAFLVVIGAVIVVIIYMAIMCLMLCLCCYCRKQDKNKPPPYRQERNLYTPDPEPMKEGGRGGSVLSKSSNGVKDVPGMTYYGLPHPFSRASSDARSHDTMELIRMGDSEVRKFCCYIVFENCDTIFRRQTTLPVGLAK